MEIFLKLWVFKKVPFCNTGKKVYVEFVLLF